MRAIIGLMLCAPALLAGCARHDVKVGCPDYVAYKVLDRKVRLTPRDGERVRFVVTKVTDTALYGRDERYEFAAIRSLEVFGDDPDVVDLVFNPASFALGQFTGGFTDELRRNRDCV